MAHRLVTFVTLLVVALVAVSPLAFAAPREDPDRVSLNLRNIDLLRVVELLVYDRGLNIVASPDITRKVTVRLQNVHWREALDVILRQSGMGYEQVGNILRIDVLERILGTSLRVEYPIKHLNKADVESLAASALTTPASFQVLEAPGPPGQHPTLTLSVSGSGVDHEKIKALLTRLDVASRARPVTVRELRPSGLYSIRVDDMPVGDAMEQLGRLLGFSVVWEDPPRGRTSANLARVTQQEAIAALLAPLGYSFELSGNVLRIGFRARFQSQPRSRIYKLTFANPIHVKALLAPLLTRTGKIEVLGDVPVESRAQETEQQRSAQGTAVVNAAGLNRASAGTSGRRAELTRGQPPSGTLLVTDTPAVLEQVAEMVKQLDHPVDMVEIETKLVEVALTGDVQLGIRWDANISANGASGTVVRFPLSKGHIEGQTLNNAFTLGTLSAQNFMIMLRALSQKNKLKVLSAPRVATLSHEPARILIGQRFPITVQQNNQQVNIQTTTLDYYQDVGIALTVTPRVTQKDLINLAIKPEVSTIASLVDNRFPIIDTREAETRLILRSGHTAVIGGLLQDRVENDEQGLPGLASLPVVGRLFGLTRKQKKRVELLVCVTPRVMERPPESEYTAIEDPPERPSARRVPAIIAKPEGE
jgi:Flp pilus assembly secretin CpaC